MERAGESRLRHGLRYAELGYRSFPLRVRIQPDEHGELEKKLFPVLDWPRIATCDRAKVESWWGEGQPWATASIGIATAQSGFSVVDCDGPEGVAKWQAIRDLYGIPDDTPHYSTPGGGEHWWYRTDPERPLPTKAHTIAHGIDTRGGYGPTGTGLVIVPPSTDDRGAYRWIVDPVPVERLPPVPEAVYALIEDRRSGKAPEAHDVEPSLPGDGTRRFTLAQAQAFVRSAIEVLEHAEKGGRNQALNDAARLVAHFGGEFWPRDQAEQRLTDLARERGLDADEIVATIDSAYKAQARDYASGEVDRSGRPLGWTATYVEPSPFGDDEAKGDEGDPFETEVEREVRKLRVREEAARRFRAEKATGRPSIAEGVIDDLDAIEPPTMLMRSLIPELGVGFLGGRSGAYKSFLAVAWACCIGTGQPWLGREEFTVRRKLKTLYVAAEGASGAAARMKAWEAHTGISRKGRVLLYPRPIQLNDEDRADELSRYVVEHGIEFLVIDTFRRSTSNGDDNSTTEMGVVFDAVARIRDDHACGALFIDHTGHAGERLRGASVKGDDADYVLIASYEGQVRGPNVPRSLTVQKLKDLESGTTWPVGLAHVPGHFPVATIRDSEMDEAVANFGGRSEWWESAPSAPEEMTEDLKAAAISGRGVGAAQWTWKLLVALDSGDGNEQGLTVAAITRMLNTVPGQDFTEPTIRGAVKLLVDTKFAIREKDRIRLSPG